jgi:hypothetical protein
MPAGMTTTVNRVDEQVQVVSSSRTDGLELSGFYIVNVANVDDATAWAARLPATSSAWSWRSFRSDQVAVVAQGAQA